MSRPTQAFSNQYLQETETADPTQIAQWLEDYRVMQAAVSPTKAKLISLKVPEDLLSAFKVKAKINGVRYQTKIKDLMLQWPKENS